MKKPIEEYYLQDHGDGNGWGVSSIGPGRWGVCTTSHLDLNSSGVIQVDIDQFFHGMLNTTENSTFMLAPDEALDLGEQLVAYAQDGLNVALTNREKAEKLEAE